MTLNNITDKMILYNLSEWDVYVFFLFFIERADDRLIREILLSLWVAETIIKKVILSKKKELNDYESIIWDLDVFVKLRIILIEEFNKKLNEIYTEKHKVFGRTSIWIE